MPSQLIRIEDVARRVEAAIITVRKDEFAAVEEHLEGAAGGGLQIVEGGKNDYKYTRLSTEPGESISVALTRCVHQGNDDAQAIAGNVLEDLDPDWLLLVGIAGGRPDDEYSLGDVILATRLHDFSFGSVSPDGETSYQIGGGDMHQAVDRLLQVKIAGSSERELREMARFDDAPRFVDHPPLVSAGKTLESSLYGPEGYRAGLLELLEDRFPGGRRIDGPRVHAGPCANANLVLENAELFERWKESARQVVQVETELVGVYKAARHRGRQNYPVLSIRGLSDIVGLKRSPRWTQYACHTAGAFAVALLRSGLINFTDGGRASHPQGLASDHADP